MAKYFAISNGLRGAYMPDNCSIVKVNTRKELKKIIENEAYYLKDAGFSGCNKKAIAWIAAIAWRIDKII